MKATRPVIYAKNMENSVKAEFHAFGVDYEEFESVPGNYSTAIIEFEDGSVGNVPVTSITFTDTEDAL